MIGEFNEIELRRLDLNLLLVFSALMRERSVAKASKRLFIGPSAVSMALARLRSAVGDELFIRAQSTMEPTARAHAIWAEVEPALASIENAVRGGQRFDPARAEWSVRFAAPDDLEFVLVPLLLEKLERQAPGVRMVVRPSDFRTLLGKLDEGDADLALSATPESGIERRHRIRRLHQDRFAVLYDRDQLGRTGSLDLATYAETPQVLVSILGDTRGPIDASLADLGLERRVVATIAHFALVPHILRRRRVVANMPALAAGYVAENYDLEICAPPFPSPRFDLSLAWHARTDADPANIWFRTFVADAIEQLRNGRAVPT